MALPKPYSEGSRLVWRHGVSVHRPFIGRQSSLSFARSASLNALQRSLSFVRSLTPSLEEGRGCIFTLLFSAWWGPIPHRDSTIRYPANPLVHWRPTDPPPRPPYGVLVPKTPR